VAEPASAVREVAPPPGGLWRIGRAGAPLTPFRTEPQLLALPRAGNRFDAPDHGTLYFATTVHACYGETLASHRPRPELAALVAAEWDRLHHLAPAQLPRDWRTRRVTVHITGVVVCLRAPSSMSRQPKHTRSCAWPWPLNSPISATTTLDVAAVRGPDRRLTRLIAAWAWRQRDSTGRPRYAGLRYLSRLDSRWECWAVFDDVPLLDATEHSILVDDPALVDVSALFHIGLR